MLEMPTAKNYNIQTLVELILECRGAGKYVGFAESASDSDRYLPVVRAILDGKLNLPRNLKWVDANFGEGFAVARLLEAFQQYKYETYLHINDMRPVEQILKSPELKDLAKKEEILVTQACAQDLVLPERVNLITIGHIHYYVNPEELKQIIVNLAAQTDYLAYFPAPPHFPQKGKQSALIFNTKTSEIKVAYSEREEPDSLTLDEQLKLRHLQL